MSNPAVPHIRQQRLITCILSRGHDTQALLRDLRDLGITTASVYHARGAGGSAAQRSYFAGILEKDILSVLVPKSRADEIFAWLYEAAKFHDPHQGMMFMEKVAWAGHFNLPETAVDFDHPDKR
jgi:nitrogen regulatory protein PII